MGGKRVAASTSENIQQPSSQPAVSRSLILPQRSQTANRPAPMSSLKSLQPLNPQTSTPFNPKSVPISSRHQTSTFPAPNSFMRNSQPQNLQNTFLSAPGMSFMGNSQPPNPQTSCFSAPKSLMGNSQPQNSQSTPFSAPMSFMGNSRPQNFPTTNQFTNESSTLSRSWKRNQQRKMHKFRLRYGPVVTNDHPLLFLIAPLAYRESPSIIHPPIIRPPIIRPPIIHPPIIHPPIIDPPTSSSYPLSNTDNLGEAIVIQPKVQQRMIFWTGALAWTEKEGEKPLKLPFLVSTKMKPRESLL